MNQFEQREYKYVGGVFYQKCTSCKKRLTREEFIKDNSSKFWIRTKCKCCKSRTAREYHKQRYEKNRDLYRGKFAAYQKENSTQRYLVEQEREVEFANEHGFSLSKFHHKARYYVKKYKLRPNICPICWRNEKIQIHHPSYETFEKWSSIVFCCHYCHSAIHNGHMGCPEPIDIMEYNSP